MLLITQADALPCRFQNALSDVFIGNREGENLCGNSGLVEHGQLSFPGLAYPALFRHFLDVSDAFAGGVREVKADPRPCRDARNYK